MTAKMPGDIYYFRDGSTTNDVDAWFEYLHNRRVVSQTKFKLAGFKEVKILKDSSGKVLSKTECWVKKTTAVEVSTVFLGLDHAFGRTARPVLFETMIFGGPEDGDQRRWCTEEEAQRGHNAIVADLLGLAWDE